jgi:hypothetical protein
MCLKTLYAGAHPRLAYMAPVLQLFRGEGVALGGVPTLQAAPEPPHALLGTPMRERFWHHSALLAPLQAIVANLSRSMQSGLDIRLVYKAAPGGGMPPYPGQAVRL